MEFSFDLSQTPIIGRRFQVNQSTKTEQQNLEGKTNVRSSSASYLSSSTTTDTSSSPQKSISLTQSTVVEVSSTGGWKRPYLSQVNHFFNNRLLP